MAKFEITVGADPEFFLKSGNTFIPSTRIIGGTKENPIPIPLLPDGFCMQEDNIMGEFNIPPCKTAEEFSEAINVALGGIRLCLPKNIEIAIQPSAEFRSKFIRTPEAKIFGCDPDFNAWTRNQNVFVRASDPKLRCCGGHVHVGLPTERRGFENEVNTVRAMDVYLGLPSIVLDTDKKRREMYGKAGSFRPKSFGIEYRTLSNFWIADKPLRQWVFKQTQIAVDTAADTDFTSMLDDMHNEIVSAINNQDAHSAGKLCEMFEVATP